MFMTVENLTDEELVVGYPVNRTLAANGDSGDTVTVGISREDLLVGDAQGRPAFKELNLLAQQGKATITIDGDAAESGVMFQADRTPTGIANTVVADKTALKAIASADRTEGDVIMLASDRSLWRFSAASTAADTTENLVLTPGAGTGRWLRSEKSVGLKMAIGFATADAAVLFTVPVGFRLLIEEAFWEATSDFTGGTASAIGLSSSQAPHTTKGDLLGGAAGNVEADLTAAIGITQGTLGTSFSATPKKVVLEAGSTIRFDRITSVFTAGAGFAHAKAQVIA